MTIEQLVNEHGIGICIGAGALGILVIIAGALVLGLLFLLLYVGILKAIEHDFDIDFDTLGYIQNNFYKLETRTSELKSCQLSHCCQKSAKDSSRK